MADEQQQPMKVRHLRALIDGFDDDADVMISVWDGDEQAWVRRPAVYAGTRSHLLDGNTLVVFPEADAK